MRRFAATVALTLAVLAAGALLARPGDWSVVTGDAEFTNVPPARRTWEFVRNPEGSVANAWKLAVRMPRRDQPAERARVTVERTLRNAVRADRMIVQFFGSPAEGQERPSPELVIFVHCVTEMPGGEWVQVGSQDVMPLFTAQQVEGPVNARKGCDSQIVDALRVQVRGARRKRDFAERTAYLTRVQLKEGGAFVLDDDDFTQPN